MKNNGEIRPSDMMAEIMDVFGYRTNGRIKLLDRLAFVENDGEIRQERIKGIEDRDIFNIPISCGYLLGIRVDTEDSAYMVSFKSLYETLQGLGYPKEFPIGLVPQELIDLSIAQGIADGEKAREQSDSKVVKVLSLVTRDKFDLNKLQYEEYKKNIPFFEPLKELGYYFNEVRVGDNAVTFFAESPELPNGKMVRMDKTILFPKDEYNRETYILKVLKTDMEYKVDYFERQWKEILDRKDKEALKEYLRVDRDYRIAYSVLQQKFENALYPTKEEPPKPKKGGSDDDGDGGGENGSGRERTPSVPEQPEKKDEPKPWLEETLFPRKKKESEEEMEDDEHTIDDGDEMEL